MKRVKTLFWAILTLFKSLLGKKGTKITESSVDRVVKKTFNFVGSARKPFKNARLFEMDAEHTIKEVAIIDNGENTSRGFLNPNNHLCWALNRKNAIKKFGVILNAKTTGIGEKKFLKKIISMNYKGWKIIPSYRVGWFEAAHKDHDHFIYEKSVEELVETINENY